MKYLDNYLHDVFVSYAHSDLLTPWSKELCATLVKHLNELLDLKGERSVDLWMDYRLEGNVGLTPQLEEHVKGSGLLLIVMSNFYLESPWCRNEAEWFAAQCKARSTSDGRIFVVRCRPTNDRGWPEFLKDDRGAALSGYQFYADDRRSDLAAWPFGHPVPQDAVDESRREYFRAVTGLAQQMQKRLRQLASATPPPISQRPPLSRIRLTETRLEQPTGTNVLLAVPTEDVAPEQEALRAKLVGAGFQVLPEPAQSQPAAVSQLITDLAPSCTAAAMVLGELPGRSFQIDGRPFVRWQQEQIARLGLPHIVWLPQSVDLQSIRDPDYRAFVDGVKAVRGDDAAAIASAVAELIPGSGGPRRFVFLDTPQGIEVGDAADANGTKVMEQELRSILTRLNARVFPMSRGRPASIDLSELEASRRRLRTLKAQCDAVLLVLQNPDLLPDLWLLEFERDIAPAAQELRADHQLPRCAIVDATGAYEPGNVDGLPIFRYPNAALQTELKQWLT
jgi:TIR domain